ncbi:MAG: phospholipase D family protein [Deltaproteobacteria bacterium]|nr:phospholipase D family protein [Deltaproteobacteria bacterium]
MHTMLPTCTLNSWSVTSMRDSLCTELIHDKEFDTLQMFFYAITLSGWNEIRGPVLRWMRSKKKRAVTVYVGTDHAITDPAALELMQTSAIDVQLMNSYRGIYHPKVVWLRGKIRSLVWVGSNNLTKDGLLHNIEFAVLINANKIPKELSRWASGVALGSQPLDAELLQSYKQDRKNFEKTCTKAKTTTFTWSRKHEPEKGRVITVQKGDLIIEIMPEETRGGNQIQFPKEAAREFFGLKSVGEQKMIKLRRKGETEIRSLLITVFKNNTVRLSINELEYRDRPCVITFHKTRSDLITFDIVSESIFPTRYRDLIAKCTRQTREGSRRWAIR